MCWPERLADTDRDRNTAVLTLGAAGGIVSIQPRLAAGHTAARRHAVKEGVARPLHAEAQRAAGKADAGIEAGAEGGAHGSAGAIPRVVAVQRVRGWVRQS